MSEKGICRARGKGGLPDEVRVEGGQMSFEISEETYRITVTVY